MRAARGRLADEEFSTSPREIERRLALADEMRLVLEMERDFPGESIPTLITSSPNCASRVRSSTWRRS